VTESHLLFEIILLLGLAAAGLALFERLRLPAIAGFLVVGAIAGPGALGLVQEPARVRVLAEIGVVFLLFEIGLELPLERVRRLWRDAVLAGGVQVAATIALVAAGATALGLPPAQAFVLGALLAMSSTALVMRLLTDRGQLDAPHGQVAVSVLVFQDLSIVPLLLAVPLLAEPGSGSGWEIPLAVGRVVGALLLVFLVVRALVPRVLEHVAQVGSSDLFSLLAILIVLGSAFFAEEVGLTLAIGAFLAGVAASSSPYANQLFSEVVPLRGVLLGIFFTAVGMLFEPRAVLEHAPLVVGYLGAAVVLKAVIVALVATLVIRKGIHIGVMAALALAQTGEFSFVLAEVAREAGLLERSLFQVVIAGSILSLLATPFLMQVAPRVAERVARSFESDGGPAEPTAPGPAAQPDAARAIVIGFGVGGQTLTRLFRSLGIPYLVVEANAKTVQEALDRGEPIVYGDATRTPLLHRIGVEHARLVALAISDPLATRRVVSRIRSMAPETPIFARTRWVREVDRLYEAGANAVAAEEFEGSLALLARVLERLQIPPASVRSFVDALREEGYGAIRTPPGLPIDPWLLELLENVETEWVEVPEGFPDGVTLVDLDARARSGASVLAVERRGATTANPGSGFSLRAGDRLLALGDPSALARLGALLRDRKSR
jgi:CPA2 family monovalent cation:H+ antiporter-2